MGVVVGDKFFGVVVCGDCCGVGGGIDYYFGVVGEKVVDGCIVGGVIGGGECVFSFVFGECQWVLCEEC